MRFAALPVGAASLILSFSLEKILIIAFIIVVLPVPGPPVITTTLFSTEHLNASSCFSARVIESCF